MTRNRLASLTALGVDNFGSGLFLPVALLYVTRIVRLPLATAGTIIALETMAGLAVPPIAGRLVDRAGPRLVVISAQLLQALGAGSYLVARGPALVAAAAVLLAVGQQMFYCSLFALISASPPWPWVPRSTSCGARPAWRIGRPARYCGARIRHLTGARASKVSEPGAGTPRFWFPSRHDIACIRRIDRAAAVVHRGHGRAG